MQKRQERLGVFVVTDKQKLSSAKLPYSQVIAIAKLPCCTFTFHAKPIFHSQAVMCCITE